MAWLLHNYYLPTLNPTRELAPASPPRPLLPILKSYKDIMKTITRDVALLPRHRPKLITVLRDLERWIAECKVAANVAVGELGYAIGDADFKEIWALESLCDGLVANGMLVPLSKKSEIFFLMISGSQLTVFHSTGREHILMSFTLPKRLFLTGRFCFSMYIPCILNFPWFYAEDSFQSFFR